MKTKFKKGDVVYIDDICFEFVLLVIINTYLTEYSDKHMCLLQWNEVDKKTGLPRLTTCWEHLLVKIGEL